MQYSKEFARFSDLTFMYYVNLEVRFCYTGIAGVASFILIPKSQFCQKWRKICCGTEPSECDSGDEDVMKIHKKIKIVIPEIGTFSAIAYKI